MWLFQKRGGCINRHRLVFKENSRDFYLPLSQETHFYIYTFLSAKLFHIHVYACFKYAKLILPTWLFTRNVWSEMTGMQTIGNSSTKWFEKYIYTPQTHEKIFICLHESGSFIKTSLIHPLYYSFTSKGGRRYGRMWRGEERLLSVKRKRSGETTTQIFCSFSTRNNKKECIATKLSMQSENWMFVQAEQWSSDKLEHGEVILFTTMLSLLFCFSSNSKACRW